MAPIAGAAAVGIIFLLLVILAVVVLRLFTVRHVINHIV